MSDRVAFLDESKGGSFVLVAIICDRKKIPGYRRELNEARLKGQRRIHMRNESQRRKKTLVDLVEKMDIVCVAEVSHLKHQPKARAQALEALVIRLAAEGVLEIVIEMDESFVQADNKILAGVIRSFDSSRAIRYRHESPAVEPMLWAADIYAWNYAKNH